MCLVLWHLQLSYTGCSSELSETSHSPNVDNFKAGLHQINLRLHYLSLQVLPRESEPAKGYASVFSPRVAAKVSNCSEH